ncbi:hypothetical protein BJX65DRAFT_314342 [Aspergillus insuetus]
MLPPSLRIFKYKNRCETVWHKSVPGPDLLIGGKDMLALNLRQLSSHLQELKLTGVILDREFLCPLDDHGKPAMPLLEWPYLKVFVYEECPNFLASGQWLADPTEEELEDNEVPDWNNPSQEDWDSFRILREAPYRRSVLNTELAHRCFTSLGLAAQRMSQLESASFLFMVNPTLEFLLYTDESTGKITLQ